MAAVRDFFASTGHPADARLVVARCLVPFATLASACDKPPVAQPPLQEVTIETFAYLHVLDGRWRRARGGGDRAMKSVAIEQYRFVNDSTIEISGGEDTASDRVRRLGEIQLRGGIVRHIREDTLVATGIARRGATFLREDGTRGGFTFSRVREKILITTHDGVTLFGYTLWGTQTYALSPIGGT